MEEIVQPPISRLQSLKWWALLLLFLFLVDDALTGWVFWTLSTWNQAVATVFAFTGSLLAQSWLLFRAGWNRKPGRFAQYMLDKLLAPWPRPELQLRDEHLRRQASTYLGALAVTLLMGAVIPLIALKERGRVTESRKLTVFAWGLMLLYASEYASLHGGYGLGGLVNRWAPW